MRHFQAFGTVQEFVTYCATAKPEMPDDQRSSLAETKSYGTFDRGTASLNEAIQLAREGWPEGREQIESFIAQLAPQLSGLVLRPEYHRDTTGQFFDIASIVEGLPECWFDERESEMRADSPNSKIVRIHLSGAVSGSVQRDVINRRGAAITCLVDALEAANRRCEVSLDLAASGGKHSVEMQIMLKRADEPLQIDQLAFFLMHPATLRRLGFVFWEMAPAIVREALDIHYRGRYGSPLDGGTDLEKDIWLPSANIMDRHWQSDDGAFQWITEHLKQFGVTLTSTN